MGEEQGAAQEPGLDRGDGGAAAREPFGDLARRVEGGELGLVVEGVAVPGARGGEVVGGEVDLDDVVEAGRAQ